ncbi:MAG: hypothetical protein J2O38_07900 [Acidimicrobiales bacterium]|nr:hypothetical protein [Acidimicrobiales bacterium]
MLGANVWRRIVGVDRATVILFERLAPQTLAEAVTGGFGHVRPELPLEVVDLVGLDDHLGRVELEVDLVEVDTPPRVRWPSR